VNAGATAAGNKAENHREKDETKNTSAPGEWQPRILTFACNWCSYAGADLAGVSRFQYPPSIRILRVMCSGRVHPEMVLEGFAHGADAVLVTGCHIGDCHYISGNLVARRKFALLKELIQYAGIEPERVQFTWVSASEGGRFAAVVEKVVQEVRRLGPNRKLVKML